MTIQEYIKENPAALIEINNINTLFNPFNMAISEVIRCAQSVKYILRMPLDLNAQDKVRKAEKKISYSLSSAIQDAEYTYGHENNYVYIERPAAFNVVSFREFRNRLFTNRLLLALGQDQNGTKLITDLAKAPHILVAGTTGSGKSELLHSFIASLICGMPYSLVELLIIDPKRAEFSPYKNCKRIRVVTEMQEAQTRIENLVNLMEVRYTELERNNAKDIYKYTGNMDMHPIVIVIDELADLMLTCPAIEKSIVRIAQKARACGIHLIVGTQSPRRDVITGLIKANMPTKIALRTSNQIESRIILDQNGAEKLCGKGDMLFIGNGKFEPIRVQSAYVSEEEKKELAEFIAMPATETNAQPTPQYAPQSTAQTYKTAPQKKVGFFQGLKNIWNAPQKTTARDYVTVIRR